MLWHLFRHQNRVITVESLLRGFLRKTLNLGTYNLLPRLVAVDVLICFFPPLKPERDAFDTLFDHAPDKLSVVKKVKNKVQVLFATLLFSSYAFAKVSRKMWKTAEEDSEIVKRMFITKRSLFQSQVDSLASDRLVSILSFIGQSFSR